MLESLVTFSDCGDVLAFAPSDKDALDFTGPFADLLTRDHAPNLVEHARDLVRKIARTHACPPVAITLEKNLPIASGIGGGSADAAATLKGLNALWGLGWSIDELTEIGLSLGADVPMCIHNRPLIAKGIGEIVEPVELPALSVLLVNPGVAVSTPAIFKALKTKANGALPPHSNISGTLGDFLVYLENSRNDLQPAAIALAARYHRCP